METNNILDTQSENYLDFSLISDSELKQLSKSVLDFYEIGGFYEEDIIVDYINAVTANSTMKNEEAFQMLMYEIQVEVLKRYSK